MKKPLFFQRPLPYTYFNATIILLVLNAVVYAMKLLAPNMAENIYLYLTLIPQGMPYLQNYYSFLTYMFVHGDQWHFLFNMFTLFMFGITIEKKLGSAEFLLYYLTTGLLCGIVLYLLDISMITGPGAYIGASGAIFAVLLAFATFFPNSTVRIWFIIPVKAYALIIGLIVFSIVAQITGIFGQTSHIGHLSGLFFGFLYFIIRFRINPIKEFINARRYNR